MNTEIWRNTARPAALHGPLVYVRCRALIQLLIGKQSLSPGIDRMTASPDLFVEGGKV
jgi:hypothetical protein